MRVIRLPSPAHKQSLRAVELDRESSLTNGLLRLFNFALPLSSCELVAGPSAVTTLGTLTLEANDRIGLGIKVPSAGSARFNDDWRLQVGSAITYFCDFEYQSGVGGFFFANAQHNSTGYNGGLYLHTDNKVYFYIRNTGGTAVFVSGTTVLVAGQRYQVVGTYDGAFNRVYVNGVFENSAAQTGNVQQADYDLSLNRWNAASPFAMRYFQAGVAGRTWSPGEVLDWYLKPWQMLRSRALRVLVPEVAAGGSVFIPIIGRGPGMALAGSGGLAS